jgi:hypothetical protein
MHCSQVLSGQLVPCGFLNTALEVLQRAAENPVVSPL